MPTFGGVVIHIITTIISSIVDTTVDLAKDVVLLFQIIQASAGVAPPFVIVSALAVFAVIVLALFKLVKGDLKHLVVAGALLVILVLVSFLAARG